MDKMKNIITKYAKKYLTAKYMSIYLPPLVVFILLLLASCTIRIEYEGNIPSGIMGIANQPSLLAKALPFNFNIGDFGVGVAGAAIVALLLAEKRSNRKKFKTGVEHGSARWGTKKDIEPYIDPDYYNNVLLSKTERLTMNPRPKDWKTARNKNVLVVGGSGSGKTRSILKPNLMQMHSSYVVTDPKGTIVNECGHMLKRSGYRIKVLNLIDLNKSMKYNPLEYVEEPGDILKLIETLIANTSGTESKGEDFWVKAERLLYQALIAAIMVEEKLEKNFGILCRFLAAMEVREEDEGFKNSIDYWFDDLRAEKDALLEKGDSTTPEEKRKLEFLVYGILQYDSYKLAAGKTAKSILISCAARLASVNIPEVNKMLSRDEMDLRNLGEKKTALFIIIPDTDSTFNFIASILYTQMFNILCTIADTKHGGQLPVHVRCLMDEFANIGKIPQWEVLIATIRSREISALMVLQTKAQLKAMYKENAETIIGNCDTEVFLGGKEQTTLKDLSESMGKETINDININESRGNNPSTSSNYSKLGKELMSINELSSMDRGKCVVQISGLPPFLSNKYDITEHPRFKYHANGIDDPKWFDIGRYIKAYNRPNKIKDVNKLVKEGKTKVETVEMKFDLEKQEIRVAG